MKVNKSGRCHNLGPGRVPWRNVSEPLMVGLDFHVISIFFLHRTLYKIHMWKLFVYEKIFGHGKIKSGRKSSVKKKGKKIGAKKKERVPFCQEKRIPLWKRLVLAELHASVQISNKEFAVKPKLAIHDVKNEVPFLYASTSCDTKALKVTSNRNFESYMSIRCRAPQHIFHVCRGFFLCFWQLCSLLCRPPQRSLSDRDKR